MKIRRKIFPFFIILFLLVSLFYFHPATIKRIITQNYYKLETAILPFTLPKTANTQLAVPFYH